MWVLAFLWGLFIGGGFMTIRSIRRHWWQVLVACVLGGAPMWFPWTMLGEWEVAALYFAGAAVGIIAVLPSVRRPQRPKDGRCDPMH